MTSLAWKQYAFNYHFVEDLRDRAHQAALARSGSRILARHRYRRHK